MPTLAAWLRSGSHALTSWHTDWSSQTGASVCGILHGSNHDILGFRCYEKDRDHVVSVSHPADAAEVERRTPTGRGAAGRRRRQPRQPVQRRRPARQPDDELAAAGAPRGGPIRRRERVGAGYYAYFANPVNAVRTLGVSLVDVYRELVAAARQRRADVRRASAAGGLYPLARPGTTVIARDVVVAAILEDMLAGRPVVYADFLGYDEVAHHSGVERFDTLRCCAASTSRSAGWPAPPSWRLGTTTWSCSPTTARRQGEAVRAALRRDDRGVRPGRALRRLAGARYQGPARRPAAAGEGWQVASRCRWPTVGAPGP
jgi:hypothetical protein